MATLTEPTHALREFRIIEETWTDYDLEDGSSLRIKPILTFLLQDGKTTQEGYAVATQIATWSPPALRKMEKAQPAASVDSLEKAIEKKDLKIALVNEGKSRYRTPQGELTLRATVKVVHRSSLYDLQGQPQYYLVHSLEYEIPRPPKAADAPREK